MKIISLFSGAGGMDLGMLYAGHEIVYSNDFDKHAFETYRENIGKYHPHVSELGDIKEILDDYNNRKLKDIKADIIIGGFPCQGFSIANNQRSMEDSRNFLYLQILRLIKFKEPKFFLLENVKGLENMEDGRILKMILNDLSEVGIGYDIVYTVINSLFYGVPQNRERIIIFGVRKNSNQIIKDNKKSRSDFISNDLSINSNSISYVQFINSLYEAFKNDGNALKFVNYSFLSEQTTLRDAISDLPKDFNKDFKIKNHDGSKCKVHPKESKKSKRVGNRPTSWDKYSPTIMGRGSGTGGPLIIPHPDHHRRLSVRETARIQSFPDEFVFKGSISSQYRQVGNAVPVLLSYNIGLYLKSIENL